MVIEAFSICLIKQKTQNNNTDKYIWRKRVKRLYCKKYR